MVQLIDTSQTYLLFQTLLLLFWPHSCMIWTKLTRTDVVFSRVASAVLLCVGFWIFRYAGKIPEKYIINQRSRSLHQATVGPHGIQGVPGALLARPPLAAPGGSWDGPNPLVPYLSPHFNPRRGNYEIEVTFLIYAAEPPPPSV